MKAFIAFVALIALLVGTYAVPLKPAAPLPSEIVIDDIIDFVDGFIVGFQIGMNDNVNKCVADANITFQSFEASFSDLDAGLKARNISLVGQGIVEFGEGLNDIVKVLNFCGAFKIAAEIEEIAMQIISGGYKGIIKVVMREVIHITHNAYDLTENFLEAIEGFLTGEFYYSGKASGEVVGILVNY
eukprot:Phypoly_transcript_21566.p1 GENE.Phypoly_transcript_21566~~Phypoly_transcript_21566.p1  ORF type:complete len:196 (+),score=27.09 Phypoly_transcript_21566:31-588(+)